MTRKERLKNNWAKTKRIFVFIKPYRKLWLVLFIVSLLLSSLSLINPLIVRFLIDKVLLLKNYQLLTQLMLFFLGLTLVVTAVRIITSYLYRKMALGILYDVRNQLFRHLEHLQAGFFEKRRLGDILTRLSSDVGGIEQFISLMFNGLIGNGLNLIFILAFCLYLNAKMTLLAIIVVPFYVISQRYFAPKLRGLYRVLQRQSAFLMSFFEEKLSAMALVQLFGREEYELSKEKRIMKRLIDTNLKTTLMGSFAGTVIGLLTFSALLFVLWYGGYQVIIGVMSLGTLLALYSYLGGLFSPIEALAGLYTAAQNSLAQVDRVFQFLDIKPEIAEKIGAPDLPPIKGEIVFKNVSFNYGHEPTLKNINLRIAPGETIGIVGASGSGKTTLVNLITRIYDPSEGEVLIDGHNLKDVSVQSLHRQIGLASQNVILFHASIKENLNYGCAYSCPLTVLGEAAREAKIDQMIESLPKKYNTLIGEKGLTLSGGERQRVSLARTILKKPNLVILDEATSFLDFPTEIEVLDNFKRIFGGKTMIFIAHRLATLENINRIIVLKDGQIAEEGNFRELISLRGEFYRFYQYQRESFYRFKENLSLELKKSLARKARLALGVIKIKNIDLLLAQEGEKEISKKIDHFFSELAKNFPQPAFGSQSLDQKNMFLAAFPETDKGAAEKKIAETLSRLKPLFPEFEVGEQVTEDVGQISDIDYYLKNLPTN